MITLFSCSFPVLYSSNLFRLIYFIDYMEQENHASQSQKIGKTGNDFTIPLAIIFAGVLVAGAIIFSDQTKAPQQPGGVQVAARGETGVDNTDAPVSALQLSSDDHVMGNPNANVLIIEYSDPECPFCKRFHETMLQIMDNYGKTGSVAWVYRHWPLDQLHPKARKESEALECANELGGNAAFWKYTDKLFEITPSNNGLDAAQLPQIATTIGLDGGKFSACLASGKWADRVQRDFENGVTAGVRGTPYTIVYNKKTGKQLPINGALPYDQVKTVLGIVASAPAQPK